MNTITWRFSICETPRSPIPSFHLGKGPWTGLVDLVLSHIKRPSEEYEAWHILWYALICICERFVLRTNVLTNILQEGGMGKPKALSLWRGGLLTLPSLLRCLKNSSLCLFFLEGHSRSRVVNICEKEGPKALPALLTYLSFLWAYSHSPAMSSTTVKTAVSSYK